MDKSFEELSKMSYQEVAYEVMKLMLDDFTEEELKSCINKAYDSKFDTKVSAPRGKEVYKRQTIAKGRRYGYEQKRQNNFIKN